jgi:aspartyl-tRNA(Asn)/glutamyl-tRNA(Gln) amidotransferase subunit A
MIQFRKFGIQDLLEGYQRKEFKPSEVVASCLETVSAHNPEANALLEVRAQEALARAKELDGRAAESAKLPLFGVPVAIKDNILIKGWKTTAASKILENYVSPYTGTCVERLEAAGAIVLGKANCDEFAMGSSNENSAFGAVKNPWDPSRVTGGSSGGSAASVAAGFVPGSLGTDTGGSIRQPASLCGVVGIKPTYGRVSRYGVIAFASSLDQVGPFGRSVWDAARMLEVISGYDAKDATSSRGVVPKFTEALSNPGMESLRNLTIGLAPEWMEGVDPQVRASYDSAVSALKSLGAKTVEVKLPHAKYALSVYYLIAASEASSNLARYDGVHYGLRAKAPQDLESLYSRSRGEGFGREVKLRIMLGTYALSAGYYDAFYGKANQVRRLIQKDFDDAFSKCHCVAVPTSPTTAFKLGEKVEDPLTMYLSDIFTLPINLAGLPGLSVPCGLDSQRLPVGLQLIGKQFDEAQLLHVAAAYEKARGPLAAPPWKGGQP